MTDLTKVTCVEDFRRLAKRRVPRMFYEYADTGSWTESTYHENAAAWQKLKFRQRVATNIEHRSVRTTMLGDDVTMPVAIAPIGLAGMQHADGEILGAQAAEDFGIPFILSTVSICSIEDVAAHTKRPFWFQLYVMRDRGFINALIDRAKAAHCSALVVTLDLQVAGQRHKDIKNGLSAPPRPTIANCLNLASKPRWCWRMLNTRRHTFRNIVGHADGVEDMKTLAKWNAEQLDPRLCWDDMEWLKERWNGKLVLKGITDVEDARHAVAVGADALIVSNHGGRQLDGAASTASLLQNIVDAVGDDIEVWVDGGIRSGQDVLRAVALGAKGVLIGRPFVYALAAAGRGGVAHCLQLIHNELDVTMGFCGYTDINDVDGNILLNAAAGR